MPYVEVTKIHLRYGISLTQTDDAEGVPSDSRAAVRRLFQLLRPRDLLALLDQVREPIRPSVEVEDEAEGRVGDLIEQNHLVHWDTVHRPQGLATRFLPSFLWLVGRTIAAIQPRHAVY